MRQPYGSPSHEDTNKRASHKHYAPATESIQQSGSQYVLVWPLHANDASIARSSRPMHCDDATQPQAASAGSPSNECAMRRHCRQLQCRTAVAAVIVSCSRSPHRNADCRLWFSRYWRMPRYGCVVNAHAINEEHRLFFAFNTISRFICRTSNPDWCTSETNILNDSVRLAVCIWTWTVLACFSVHLSGCWRHILGPWISWKQLVECVCAVYDKQSSRHDFIRTASPPAE